MGNFGSALGALLQGSAQGFLEAQEEDKIQKRIDKEKASQQKRETAKLLLSQPGLRREAQTTILAFLSGDTKAEKPFLEMLGTGTIPGSAQPEVQEGLPAVVDQQGRLDRNQNQAIGLPTEGPVPLELPLPPAESFAPLDPITTLGPEQSILRTREEDIETALLTKEKELRISQRLNEETQRADDIKRFTDFEETAFAVIKAEGLAPDSAAATRLVTMAQIAARTGATGAFERAVSFVTSPSLAMAELSTFVSSLDVVNMSPDQIVQLTSDAIPVAFESMEGAEEFVRSHAQALRIVARDKKLSAQYELALNKYKLANQEAELFLKQSSIALGGASLEDLIKLENSLGQREDSLLKDIGEIAIEREKLGADFSPKSEALQLNLSNLELGYRQQLADVRARRFELTDRINAGQGKQSELDDASQDRPPTEAELVKQARQDPKVFNLLPMSNDAKMNHVVRTLAREKNEGQVLNFLQRMASISTDENFVDPMDAISFDDIDEIQRQVNQERTKLERARFRQLF